MPSLSASSHSPSQPPPERPKILSSSQTLLALETNLPSGAHYNFLAFYSSVVNGIITEPSLMTIPIDEHMAHRGHAVFDTANIVDGKCYGLDFHLDRLLRSAGLARIKPSRTKEELRHIILSTIAASQEQTDIFVRFWMTAGRGDFSVSSKGTGLSNFFCMVHRYTSKADYKLKGVAECVVKDIPLKPPILATIKSNNYLINALTCEAAEDQGGFLGIQLDERGCVAESSIGNIAILDKQGLLRTPPFGKILAGTTVKRLWELSEEKMVKEGKIKGVNFSEVTLDDLLNAREIYSLGGGSVLPIVKINDKTIGDGKPGPIFQALDALLMQDMVCSQFLDEIPYSHPNYYKGGLIYRGGKALCRFVYHHTNWMTVFLVWVALPAAFDMGRRKGGPIYSI